MIWDMNGRGYKSLPGDIRDVTEQFSAEVEDVFGGVADCLKYATLRIYATEERINFLVDQRMLNELDVSSFGDLVGRNYHAYIGYLGHGKTVHSEKRIIAIEAVDFSDYLADEVERLNVRGRPSVNDDGVDLLTASEDILAAYY